MVESVKRPTKKRPARKTTAKKRPAKKSAPKKRTPKKRTPKKSAPKTELENNEPQFMRFIERISDGREFLLACTEATADPKDIIDRLKTDEEFVQLVNTAKRIAYEKVQAALYDAAAKGSVAAIKEWNLIRAHLHDDEQFDQPIREADVASASAKKDSARRAPKKVG